MDAGFTQEWTICQLHETGMSSGVAVRCYRLISFWSQARRQIRSVHGAFLDARSMSRDSLMCRHEVYGRSKIVCAKLRQRLSASSDRRLDYCSGGRRNRFLDG